MPRLLDLFCGAGGAAMGYHRAGFDVVGVDISPQPHYPFKFIQADAMTYPLDGFDTIHASPPCQAYSTMGNRKRLPAPDLLEAVIERLRSRDSFARFANGVGVPWVVENVLGAKRLMPGAFTLTGGMFGLRVHRPRLFLCSETIVPPARAPLPENCVGVYGRAPDGRTLWNSNSNSNRKTLRAAKGLPDAQDAMGMDWADWHGIKEAIPPAYTEFIGRQLLAALDTEPDVSCRVTQGK